MGSRIAQSESGNKGTTRLRIYNPVVHESYVDYVSRHAHLVSSVFVADRERGRKKLRPSMTPHDICYLLMCQAFIDCSYEESMKSII